MSESALVQFGKALAAPARVRILMLLRGRALCVNAFAARLDVTQGAVSQHLRVLREAGIVLAEKRGCFVHYRLNERTLAAWREEMDKLLDPGHGACTDMKGAGECAAATRKTRKRKAARSRKT
jgi:DNA-binding transcriptional ArsR family regulator